MSDLTRRGLMAAGLVAGGVSQMAMAASGPEDGDYWSKIADLYDPIRQPIQLENGNWGMMARSVAAANERHLAMVNRNTSFYSRRGYGADLERVRARTAASLGVSVNEIAFTRGATEALLALIGGYNRLKPGDAVLVADLDYDSMLTGMNWLKTRRGVEVVSINLPEQGATHQSLIDTYEAALKANPKVRLMLLTEVSHRTGLVLPIKEIVAMARALGVDALVDAAHAWGQLGDRLGDKGVDFAGLNAHKWIGAPLGVGVMYIRQGRTADIDVYMGTPDFPDPLDVRNRIHTGTVSLATMLSLEDALALHDSIGDGPKAARLRWLRDRWVQPLRGLKGVEITTPDDPRLYGAITSFRLTGKTSGPDNLALAKRLLDEFGIFSVMRGGVAGGACVRITPGLFTRPEELDALTAAIRKIA
jgi:selenocysteine lyase/cysteine desulfurase